MAVFHKVAWNTAINRYINTVNFKDIIIHFI